MKEYKNNEFFKISGDKTVTVSVTFDANPGANGEVVLRNAYEAIKFFEQNGFHKSWARKIVVDKK